MKKRCAYCHRCTGDARTVCGSCLHVQIKYEHEQYRQDARSGVLDRWLKNGPRGPMQPIRRGA